MATQDEMELAKLVNRLVKASQAKDARIEALESAMESLTPGGSEFSRDADGCIAWVRDRLAGAGRVAAERNRLRSRIAELEAHIDELESSALPGGKWAFDEAMLQHDIQGARADAAEAKVARLIGALRGLRFYVNNPSAWPDAYDDQVSGAIQRAVEIADADATQSTTRPTPLQAPDPAMTLGAATDEPDARELWGIWLTDEGRWLEMPSEIETPVYLVRFGFSYSIACAVAHNASVCGYPAETRRIDLWAAGLPTD